MMTLCEILKTCLTVMLVILFAMNSVQADITTTVARETTEFLFKQFSREAAEIGAETLTRRVSQLAARYGDTALIALRRAGPKVAKIADDAADPALAMRLLAQHGDQVARIVAKPNQLQLVGELGEDAATCLMRHGDCVEPVLSTLGPKAAAAMKGLSSQNARRVSMLLADGELTKLGKADEILGVIGRYSDAGAAWVWSHKGTLTVGTTLTAFLLAPGDFIEGGKGLAAIAADAAVKPVVTSVAHTFPWAVLLVLVAAASAVAVWIWRVPRTAQSIVLRALAKGAGRIVFPKKG